MALGERVRERREQLGMTQGELADLVGVKQAAISALEKRDSRSSRQLSKLAEALRCSPEWLESGEGEPTEGYEVREAKGVYRIVKQLPYPEFKDLVNIGSGQASLEDFPKTHRTDIECSDNSLVFKVWDNSNEIPIPPGLDVLVDMDKSVEAGDFGLFYLEVGTVVIARFDGYKIGYTNTSAPPPPDSKFRPIGKLVAILMKRL